MYNKNIYPKVNILCIIRFNSDLRNIEGVILARLLNACASRLKTRRSNN